MAVLTVRVDEQVRKADKFCLHLHVEGSRKSEVGFPKGFQGGR